VDLLALLWQILKNPRAPRMKFCKISLWVFFVTLLVTLCVPSPIRAQAAPVSQMPSAEGDPSDLWLRAFMLFQQAEELEKGQKDLQALSKYRESQRLFDYIARTHPLWRPQMVNHRRRAILDAVESVQGRLQSSDPVAMKAWEQQNRGTGTPEPAPAGPQVSPQIALQPREGIALEVPAPSAPITANPAPLSALPGGAISDLSSEFQKQQAQIDLLTGANQRLEQTLRQQKDQASGLQGQLAQTREAEQRLQAQLARTVEELKQARATGGGQVAKLESQLTVAVEELKKANADSAGILKALDDARKQIAELTAQKEDLIRDRQGTMEDVAKVMAEANQAATDRDSARAERDKVKADRDDGRKALEVAQAELARLQGMKPETEAQVKALDQAKSEVAMLQDKVAQMEAVAANDAKSLKERDDLIKTLRAELSGSGALSVQNAKLLSEFEKSQTSIQQLNQQVEQLEQDRSRLERENQRLVKERDGVVAQRDQLQKDLDQMAILLNSSDRVSGDIKDILAANIKWRRELESARSEIAELSKREGGYQDEISSLKGQLTSIQKERQSLQDANARYQQTVDDLNGRLKVMLGQLDARTSEVDALTKERDGLKGLLDQKDGLLARITGQLQESKAEAAALASSKEENDLLRNLIRKQLVRQARLLEARDLVLAELRNVDVHSSQLLASLDEMSKPVVQLSEDEKAMFKEPEDLKLLAMTEAAPSVPFSTLPVAPAPSEPKVFASPGVSPRPDSPAELIKKVPALQPYADSVILSAPSVDLAEMARSANGKFRTGDFMAAARGYEEVLRWDRTNEYALCNLAVIELRMGKLDEASAYLKRARAKNSSYAPALFYEGVVAYRRGQLDAALEAFGQSVQFDSSNADAHNYMGLIASRKGWSTRAESEFNKALALKPAHSEACFNLAVLYSTGESRSKDKAKEFYQKARKNGAGRDEAIERFING
jgi:peptidoglycan hydrolase CwlO-like protein/Tfp pilus assembly protein PilF